MGAVLPYMIMTRLASRDTFGPKSAVVVYILVVVFLSSCAASLLFFNTALGFGAGVIVVAGSMVTFMLRVGSIFAASSVPAEKDDVHAIFDEATKVVGEENTSEAVDGEGADMEAEAVDGEQGVKGEHLMFESRVVVSITGDALCPGKISLVFEEPWNGGLTAETAQGKAESFSASLVALLDVEPGEDDCKCIDKTTLAKHR